MLEIAGGPHGTVGNPGRSERCDWRRRLNPEVQYAGAGVARRPRPRRRSPPDALMGERAVEVRRHRRRLRPRGQHRPRRWCTRRRSAKRRISARTSIPFDLEFDTVYSWRVRSRVSATSSDRGRTGRSSCRPRGPPHQAPTSSPAVPSALRRAAVADGSGRDAQTAGRMIQPSCARLPAPSRRRCAGSCQEHGGSWEFMDRTIDALRAKDGRYGYNCKRGNCNDPSQDVASYFCGNHTEFEGSPQVYIFDLIGGHCGPTPSATWGDVTDITISSGTIGRTTYPRRGRIVTADHLRQRRSVVRISSSGGRVNTRPLTHAFGRTDLLQVVLRKTTHHIRDRAPIADRASSPGAAPPLCESAGCDVRDRSRPRHARRARREGGLALHRG